MSEWCVVVVGLVVVVVGLVVVLDCPELSVCAASQPRLAGGLRGHTGI